MAKFFTTVQLLPKSSELSPVQKNDKNGLFLYIIFHNKKYFMYLGTFQKQKMSMYYTHRGC